MEVEPVERGEWGYVEYCIRLIERSICACEGCGGHLVDEVCVSCGCRHYVQEAGRFSKRTAAWIPVYVTGRCAYADLVRAEQRAEDERQARRRQRAEATGDPRG